MTRAELALPPDAMFDGHVQGMAMRFEVDEAVIPMRLSTFNSDEHPNRVFILADQPMKITELPERMVARQVSGERLRRTLTEPLEVRMKGGTGSDLNTWQMARLQAARSPTPYTWVAAERFADDLLSAALGTHILPHEAWSTELVNISSALGLKGPELDVLHRDVVRRRRGDPNDELAMLDTMSLTVVDGDFPSHVLRKHNLHLSPWTLSADRNVGTPWSEEALPAPEVTLWIEG
jgi:hypothetical protein